uniref:Flavin-containing monooxygenase n=1 Tax=Panagrellus redivivus TaxID=6233 RepID=A0A7E4VZW7_PANRE
MGKKRVAIVGAGASGLPAIRHALLYGFEPVCFECTEHVGGLWRYTPGGTNVHGHELSCVMKSTVINTSKEMTAFSDFPPPPEYANFMHNTKLWAYFQQYAEHFGLTNYIKFKHFVKQIQRNDNYDQTGQWKLTYLDADEKEHTEVFDAVLVATGHHAEPYYPKKWPGQDNFKGEVTHAHNYRDHRNFEDKVVAIVGVGNSGVDLAVELGRIAKQTYLVSRRGTWVFNRLVEHGMPFDIVLFRRFLLAIRNALPFAVTHKFMEMRLNWKFDHSLYGLKPEHGLFSAHPTVNDDLPNRLCNGTVVVKPNIKEFTKTGLTFEDGVTIEPVDHVILSTGYSLGFPIIENGELVPATNNEVTLYKYMYPPQLAKHNTLAIVGLIQPLGSIMPISELQVRVFYDVLSKSSSLPTEEGMQAEIDDKKREMAKQFVHSRRHTIQVDYASFMDELAEIIGCRPDIKKLALSDPFLALEVIFGPQSPYTYRINGPHSWEGARKAILGLQDRVRKGLAPGGGILRKKEEPSIVQKTSVYLAIIVLILAIWGFFF